MSKKNEFEKGFFKAPNDIFDLDLKIHEKIVYLYLCRCGNNSTAFPSYNTIANKCSISRRKAIDCVASHKELGLLRKQYRRNQHDEQQTNIYKVIAPSAHRTSPSAHDALPSEQDAPNKELDYKELDKKYPIKDFNEEKSKPYEYQYDDYNTTPFISEEDEWAYTVNLFNQK